MDRLNLLETKVALRPSRVSRQQAAEGARHPQFSSTPGTHGSHLEIGWSKPDDGVTLTNNKSKLI